MTNKDRLQDADPLARFICNSCKGSCKCQYCICDPYTEKCSDTKCIDGIKQWLESEVENNDK